MIALLTEMGVDPADLALQHPIKPIGVSYSKEESNYLTIMEVAIAFATNGKEALTVL